MDSININIEKFPVIEISVKQEVQPEHVDEFIMNMESILREKEGRFIVISDQISGTFMSGATRIALGRAIKNISEKYRSREEAVIVVNDSYIGRAMIRGLMIIARPGKNFYVVSSMEEAREKAEQIKNQIAQMAA